MKLYEVGEDIRAGFKFTVQEDKKPHITVAVLDDEYGGPACLPLGNSLCRELRHPDDQGQSFLLLWGKLDYQTAGMMLVAQTETEAARDHRALVLIDRCYVGELMTDVESVDGRTQPEHLTYAAGDGVRRDLFLLRPGDALYIRWHKDLIGARRHRKFIISWDGEQRELTKEPVLKKPKGWFAQRRQRASERKPEALVQRAAE